MKKPFLPISQRKEGTISASHKSVESPQNGSSDPIYMVRKPIWRLFTISSMKPRNVMASRTILSPITNISLKPSKSIMQEDFWSRKEMVSYMQLASLPTGERLPPIIMVLLRVTEKSVAIWLPISCSGAPFRRV